MLKLYIYLFYNFSWRCFVFFSAVLHIFPITFILKYFIFEAIVNHYFKFHFKIISSWYAKKQLISVYWTYILLLCFIQLLVLPCFFFFYRFLRIFYIHNLAVYQYIQISFFPHFMPFVFFGLVCGLCLSAGTSCSEAESKWWAVIFVPGFQSWEKIHHFTTKYDFRCGVFSYCSVICLLNGLLLYFKKNE